MKKKNSALSLSKCSSPSNKFSVTSSPRRKEGEGKGTKGGGEGGGGLTERELLILEILKELGQQGCVHAETLYGESALHMACQGVADPFIVRQLLRFGLDPLGKADASIGIFKIFFQSCFFLNFLFFSFVLDRLYCFLLIYMIPPVKVGVHHMRLLFQGTSRSKLFILFKKLFSSN